MSNNAGPLPEPTRSDIAVDDDGISLPTDLVAPLSVFFEGRRIWSLVPDREGRRAGADRRRVRWPKQLLGYLDGVATVEIRHLDGDQVEFSSPVSFGSGFGPISITDDNGVDLTIDKAGHLKSMFAERGAAQREALAEAMAEALAILHEAGVPAFLAFGGLLGAVRDGRLIAHDNDGDLAYLARSTHPLDIIMESLELERLFSTRGWRTRRMSGGDFKLQITMPNGSTVGCDVFTAFYRGDELFILPSVRGVVDPSSLLPLGSVELEGHTLAAPRDPEMLLETTYGPSWRVPDPSFAYNPPISTRRILTGLMRGERKHQRYWDDFYARQAAAVPSDPSPFAQWVAEQEPGRGGLVEVGSGTGRDTLWFSGQGFEALGCDYSSAGVAYSQQLAERQGLAAEFRTLNLYDVRHVLARGALLAHERHTDIVYARFLIHAIETVGREHLYLLARSLLSGSRGKLYAEFRTQPTQHAFGEHYRQFVSPDVVADELRERGFTIDHLEEGHGLAVHKNEDPQVCRIVATMTG